MIYAGMDISKSTIDVQIKDGETYHHYKIANDAEGHQQLIALLQDYPKGRVRLCCEYTGTYYLAAAIALHRAGYHISVVNAYSIRNYARLTMSRNKTDKYDARLIADYCERQQPAQWMPPDDTAQSIQALNRRIEQLVKMHTMEQNRQKIAPASGKASHQTIMQALQDEIANCRQQLQAVIANNAKAKEAMKLMQTVPGIGKQTAAIFLAPLLDIERFPSARHFVSWLGLSPMRKESGSSVKGKTRISKMGDAYLRKALYMPARSACLRSKAFRDWVHGHMKQGKHPKTVYVMMMRKLATYAYIVVKQNQPFDINKVKMLDD